MKWPQRFATSRRVGICVAVLVVCATGCFGQADDARPADRDDASTLSLLASQLVVVNRDGFMVALADLDEIADGLGIDRVKTCESDAERERFFESFRTLDRAASVILPNVITLSNSWESPTLYEESGIRVCEIDAVAETLVGGPDFHWVLAVDHDLAEVETAVQANSAWSEWLASTSHAQGTVHDWAAAPLGPQSVLHPSGRGGQLYVDGSIASVTGNAAITADFLDPESVRLTDLSYVAEVFEFLNERDAMMSIFLTNTDTAKGRRPAVLDPPIDPAILLVPWEVIGVGAAAGRDGETTIHVSFAHSSEDAALENANRLAAKVDEPDDTGVAWSERYVVDEIQSEGVLVTARIRRIDGSPPLLTVFTMFLGSSDNLFAIEPS